MKVKNNIVRFLFFLFLVSVCGFCFGNAGVPVIAVTYPGFMILLVPIICVEYFVMMPVLTAAKKLVFASAAVSNVVSTLIGVPLAWAMLLLVEIMTTGGSALGGEGIVHLIGSVALQSAWLVPYGEHLYWMVPTAVMINLIPTYFVSRYVEYLVTRGIIRDAEHGAVKRAVYRANNVTYAGLFLISIGYLVANVITHGRAG